MGRQPRQNGSQDLRVGARVGHGSPGALGLFFFFFAMSNERQARTSSATVLLRRLRLGEKGVRAALASGHDPPRHNRTRLGRFAVAEQLGPADREHLDLHVHPVEQRPGQLAPVELDAIRQALQEFRERAGANLAPMLREELWPVVDYYNELNRRAGCLDFLDLLLVARNLVRQNTAVRAELRRWIARRNST